jgi:hypothetical protein
MLNIKLTNFFKELIIKEDLINTGNLLNSVKVFIEYKEYEINVNIIGKNYLKYLDAKYKLVDKFINSDIFNEEIAYILLENSLKEIINIIDNNNYNIIEPKINLFINN